MKTFWQRNEELLEQVDDKTPAVLIMPAFKVGVYMNEDRNGYLFVSRFNISGGEHWQEGQHFINRAGALTLMDRFSYRENIEWKLAEGGDW